MRPVVLHEHVRIPAGVNELEAFRRWARSDEFPERGRSSFLDGEVWVDLMLEQLFTHGSVKVEFSFVLHGLLKLSRRDRFFGSRTLVTNVEARVSTEPDGSMVLFEILEAGSVELVAEAVGGYIEIVGMPDAELEIASSTSVRKDTVVLRNLLGGRHPGIRAGRRAEGAPRVRHSAARPAGMQGDPQVRRGG